MYHDFVKTCDQHLRLGITTLYTAHDKMVVWVWVTFLDFDLVWGIKELLFLKVNIYLKSSPL